MRSEVADSNLGRITGYLEATAKDSDFFLRKLYLTYIYKVRNAI